MFGCCKCLKVSTCIHGVVSPMSFPFVIHFDNLGSKKHSSVDYITWSEWKQK